MPQASSLVLGGGTASGIMDLTCRSMVRVAHGVEYGEGCFPVAVYGSTYSHLRHMVTVNGVLGWEFRRDQRTKTFLQLEVDQPVVNSDLIGFRKAPAVFLSFGVGW